MPGVRTVGTVGIRAKPLTDGFRQQLIAEIKKATNGLDVEIPVKLKGSLRDDVERVAKEAEGREVEVDVTADTHPAEQKLEQLAEKLEAMDGRSHAVNFDMDPNSLDSIRKVLRQIDEEIAKQRSIQIDSDGSLDDLMRVRDDIIRGLEGGAYAIDIDVDPASEASVARALKRIDTEMSKRREITLEVQTDAASLKGVEDDLKATQKRLKDIAAAKDNADYKRIEALREKLSKDMTQNLRYKFADDSLKGVEGRIDELRQLKLDPDIDTSKLKAYDKELDSLTKKRKAALAELGRIQNALDPNSVSPLMDLKQLQAAERELRRFAKLHPELAFASEMERVKKAKEDLFSVGGINEKWRALSSGISSRLRTVGESAKATGRDLRDLGPDGDNLKGKLGIDSLSDGFKKAFARIKGDSSDTTGSLKRDFSGVTQGISKAFEPISSRFKLLTGDLKTFKRGLSELSDWHISASDRDATTPFGDLKLTIGKYKQVFSDMKAGSAETRDVFKRDMSNIGTSIKNAFNPSIYKEAFTRIRGDWSGVAEGIKSDLSGVKDRVGKAFDPLSSRLKLVTNDAKLFGSSLKDLGKWHLNDLLDFDSDGGGAGFAGLRDKYKQVFKDLKSGSSETRETFKRDMSNVGSSIKNAFSPSNIKSNLTNLKTQLSDIGGKIRELHEARTALKEVKADVNVSSFAKAKAIMSSLGGTIKASVKAVIDSPAFAKAKAQLATLGSGIGQGLMRLSGGRVLKDMSSNAYDLIKNFDQWSMKIGTATTAIGGLSMAIASGTGSVLAFVRDVGEIGGLLGALPAFAAGAAVSIGALVMALKDAGTVLADLKPAFAEMQDSVSGAFWEQAAQPIRDMATTLLPEFTAGITKTGGALGGLFATMSNSLSGALQGRLTPMFDLLNQGIENSRRGAEQLGPAIATLGEVGSQYFPAFGTWLSDISVGFNNWLQGVAADGRLKGWIDQGITELKNLGNVVKGLGGIFGALFDALDAAGYSGLEGLADTFTRASEAMHTSGFQEGLVEVLTALHDGMGQISDSVFGLFENLSGIGDALPEIMGNLASTISGLIDGIGVALSNPAVADGITNLTQGLSDMVEGMGPTWDSLGSVIGAVATSMGQFLGTLGGVLGQTDVASSGFAQLAEAIGPVASALTGALGDALAAILPSFSDFVSAILPPLVDLITQISGVISDLAPSLGDMASNILTPLGELISELAGPIGDLITALEPLISVILTTMSESLGELITTLMPSMVDLFTILGDVIQDLSPYIQEFVQQLGQDFADRAPEIGEAVSGMVTAFGDFLKAVEPLIPVIMDLVREVGNIQMDTAIEAIQMFGDILQWAAPYVADLARVVADMVGVVVSLMQGDFKSATEYGNQAVEDFKNGVSNALDGVKGFFNEIPGFVQGVFAGAGSWLVSAGSSIMEGLKSGLVSAYESVKSFISGIGPWIAGNKGPESYDRRLLIPNGRWIMDGLDDGLTFGFKDVQKNVATMGSRLGLTADLNGSIGSSRNGGGDITINNYPQYPETNSPNRDAEEFVFATKRILERL